MRPDEPGQAPPSHGHRARRPPLKRSRVLAAAVATVIIASGGVTAFLLLPGPSYPHPWCGPVLSELTSRSGTEGSLESALAHLERQDHAPVGHLLTDLYVYDLAKSVEQDASNMAILGAISNETRAIKAVGVDLMVIGAECGQPPEAYKKDAL